MTENSDRAYIGSPRSAHDQATRTTAQNLLCQSSYGYATTAAEHQSIFCKEPLEYTHKCKGLSHPAVFDYV